MFFNRFGCGGLVDFVGDYLNENIILKDEEIAKPIYHPKIKVNPITNWLSKNEKNNFLKKVTIRIKEESNGGFLMEAYRFPNFY